MLGDLLPEIKLSTWKGHGSQVVGATIVPWSSSDEKRPRLIAVAAEPLVANGSTRRKRLLLVEPLGMWVKDGQPVPMPTASHANAETEATGLPITLGDRPTITTDCVPALFPTGRDVSMLNVNDLHGSPYRSDSKATAQAFTEQGVPLYLNEHPQQLQQQQRTTTLPVRDFVQQAHDLEAPVGFPGPLRRLASGPGLSTATPSACAFTAAVRFQPYSSSSSSSSRSTAGSPGVAVSSSNGLALTPQHPGCGSGLPLMPQLLAGRAGGGGSHGGAQLSGLLHETAAHLWEGATMGPALLGGSQPEAQHPLLESMRSGQGAAAALWRTWMSGEELPVDQGGGGGIGRGSTIDGTSGVGGGGSSVPAGLQLPLVPAGGVQRAPHAHRHYEELPAAAPPRLSPGPPGAAAALSFDLERERLQQQLQCLQQQQQQQQQTIQVCSMPGSGAGPDAWVEGCAEIWAAAFGEPAPPALAMPRTFLSVGMAAPVGHSSASGSLNSLGASLLLSLPGAVPALGAPSQVL